jgi:hypothetical protein
MILARRQSGLINLTRGYDIMYWTLSSVANVIGSYDTGQVYAGTIRVISGVDITRSQRDILTAIEVCTVCRHRYKQCEKRRGSV